MTYRLQFRDKKIQQLVRISQRLLREVQESTCEASELRDTLTHTERRLDESAVQTQILHSEIS